MLNCFNGLLGSRPRDQRYVFYVNVALDTQKNAFLGIVIKYCAFFTTLNICYCGKISCYETAKCGVFYRNIRIFIGQWDKHLWGELYIYCKKARPHSAKYRPMNVANNEHRTKNVERTLADKLKLYF